MVFCVTVDENALEECVVVVSSRWIWTTILVRLLYSRLRKLLLVG